jgi:RNA binding exosome subunit
MATEGDRFRKTIGDLQEKLKAAEQKATGYYEKEIRRVTEQYEQESQKTKALDALAKALRSGDTENKKACEKLKSQLHMLQEKYKNQSAEHSKLFMVRR